MKRAVRLAARTLAVAGVLSLVACNGQDGTNGTNGTNGIDGATGAPGVNCWDLNGNGIGDPAEDRNGDGAWTAADCQVTDPCAEFAAQASGALAFIVSDDFASAPAKSWDLCEELVGTTCGSVCAGASQTCTQPTCYGSGVGGLNSLPGIAEVRAGGATDPLHQSNHVIVGRHIADTALAGRVWYRARVRIPETNADTGQTGPEISIQATDASHMTFTGGVQYLANPYDRPGHWQLWRESSTTPWADVTADLGLPVLQLDPDLWYEVTLGVDYSAHRYLGLRVRISGGPDLMYLSAFQLKQYTIPGESKGFEPGTKITIEAENLYNGCISATQSPGDGKTYSYVVDYDDVLVCEEQN